jgi:fructuronate reductase
MDGSQKLPYRLLGTVSARLAAGREPRYASLAVAGWIRYASAGKSDSGTVLPLDDPIADKLRSAAGPVSSPGQTVAAFLAIGEVFSPELADDSTFRRLLTEDLTALDRFGAAAVVAGLED